MLIPEHDVVDGQVVVSVATLIALVGGTWKISGLLAELRTRMADKTDLAVLRAQVTQLSAEVKTLWRTVRAWDSSSAGE